MWVYLARFLFILCYMRCSCAKASAEAPSIPLISVSLNFDRDNYLLELLNSIDHPVRKVSIQIGNSNSTIVSRLVQSVQLYADLHPQLSISVSFLSYNPGSAKGFNFGLHRMMKENAELYSWCLIVNYDIAFHPGTLRYLAHRVHQVMNSQPNFGVGFLNLCCGGEWSAIILTRKMVQAVGYFDENFYPAYYEDDDYGIRIHLASYRAERFQAANISHGRVHGSKKYISGVESTLVPKKKEKRVLDAAQLAWRAAFRLGIHYSREYIRDKWNIKLASTTIQAQCKTYRGINRVCKVGYQHPFGDSSKNLSHWVLNQTRFDYLVRVGNGTINKRIKL
jgi:GT2 family glycosyltransferase